MRKAFFASALLLVLACSLSWGASAAELKPLDGTPGAAVAKPVPSPIPSPVPMASCTLSCWPDPNNPSAPPITCTSPTGNCASGGKGTYFFIMCDGVTYVCPEYY